MGLDAQNKTEKLRRAIRYECWLIDPSCGSGGFTSKLTKKRHAPKKPKPPLPFSAEKAEIPKKKKAEPEPSKCHAERVKTVPCKSRGDFRILDLARKRVVTHGADPMIADILVSKCAAESSDTEIVVSPNGGNKCAVVAGKSSIAFAFSSVVNANDPCVQEDEQSAHYLQGRHGFAIFMPNVARDGSRFSGGASIPIPCLENVQMVNFGKDGKGGGVDLHGKLFPKGKIGEDDDGKKDNIYTAGPPPSGKDFPESLVHCLPKAESLEGKR